MHLSDYESAPRGMRIKESLNVGFTITNPLLNLYTNTIRSSPLKYICQELVWYLSKDRSVTYIGKHADLWNRITNKDGTVNSNYGYLAFATGEYKFAYLTLRGDRESRQAIMHVNGASAECRKLGAKDFVCTLTHAFHIRDNKLHMTTVMRSQDIIYGLPADIAWFTVLHQQMCNDLKVVYEDLQLGTYTHFVHSLHLYEKHFDLATNMLKHNFYPDNLPAVKEDLMGSLAVNALVQNVMHNKQYNVGEDDFIKFLEKGAS
jgi:thymidylate synthase